MSERDIFCPRPFFELMLSHTGEVYPCCLLDQYPIGNVKTSDILEIWNSEGAQKIREEFLSGNIQICAENIEKRACHKYYAHYKDLIDKKVIQQKKPQKLDIRLNGLCNLKCIMCEVWKGENGAYDDTDLWKSGPSEIFPYLKYIDLLGGEPFVQSDTFRLIDEVSKVNKDCTWNFTTNGNWNLQGKIKKYLDKIKIDGFTISVDAIFPQTYKKIRLDGNYKQLMKTIDDIIEYDKANNKNMHIKLDFVLQKDNYNDLIAFYKFCKKKGVNPSVIYLLRPYEFSVEHIDRERLERFLAELENYQSDFYEVSLEPIISNIANYLAANPK